jgi:hypothetical protein
MNGGKALEGSRTLTKLQKQRSAHRNSRVGLGYRGHGEADTDETVGLGKRERTEQRAIHNRKYRRIGPDPERDDKNGNSRETRFAPQRTNILAELAEHGHLRENT